MELREFFELLEPEITDPEEETFLLFSQDFPSQNLGFIDPKAQSVDVTVNGKDYTIHQSPSILSSSRAGGTTGAVLWKITPLFSSWLSSPTNPLLTHHILDPLSSHVLELGCGISTLNALALSSKVARYTLTDQAYVQKLVQRNIAENARGLKPTTGPRGGSSSKGVSHTRGENAANIAFRALDWEVDAVTPELTGEVGVKGFDVVVACDCVYNYALVDPFVQTCTDACGLRRQQNAASVATGHGVRDRSLPPCVCIIAQQLRSDEVFECWLKAFWERFRVWRVPDAVLREGLTSADGFVVHIGLLRETQRERE